MKKTYTADDIARILSKQEREQDRLFQMAGIKPNSSGLPFKIWVSEKSQGSGHSARIKIPKEGLNLTESNSISVIIDKENPTIPSNHKHKQNSNDIDLVKKWIIKNYDVLIDYWNNEIDVIEMSRQLKKVND